MTDLARQYKPSTWKRLHTLSGNQCAAPDCDRSLVARDGETVVSKICHIEAASANGPRFNPSMDDEDRRHFNNLILLCDECHSIIDNKENETLYPVKLLKQWKQMHESRELYSHLNAKPTLLSLIINQIACADFSEEVPEESENPSPFDIEEKIKYNCVRRNRELIEEYKVFYAKVNSLYSELEMQGSFKKEQLLRNIRTVYLRAIGAYVTTTEDRIDAVQAHADDLIEDVQDELLKMISDNSSNFQEDISFGISVIMVDAFMRCKILEEPPSK